MFRSPTPGFGFTSKTYNVDETSFEYQMQLALLTTDADECYREVEKLLKKGADPNKKQDNSNGLIQILFGIVVGIKIQLAYLFLMEQM